MNGTATAMQSSTSSGDLSLDHISESPCDSLVGRLHDICTGEAKLSRRMRDAYLDSWLADGTLPADPRTATEDNVSPPQSDHRNQYRRERIPENDLNRLCRHRGEQTGTTHCKPCQSRTGKREDVAVFACAVHGSCTLYQTGKVKLPGCNKCHQFEATDGE